MKLSRKFTCSPFFVLCLFLLAENMLQKAFSEETLLQQFCDTETFRANCSSSEVILLEEARYGRMETGRCVETPMGHIGCYKDVLQLADRRCSGKRLCEIHIPNAEFESTRPCLRELKSYLEISYVCIPVANLTSSYCQQRTELEVPSLPSGFLASVVTSDTPHCAGLPWVIRAERGQRINFTVFDFTIDLRRVFFSAGNDRRSDDLDSTSCREYAIIEDGERRFPVCGGTGSRRIREVHTSRTNVAKIWMTAGVAPTDHHRFLVQYTVTGCPDPFIPESTWFHRTPDGHATAGCKRSEQSWIMQCRNHVWTSTMRRNCSNAQVEEKRLQADPESDQHADNITVAFALLAVTMVMILVLASTVCLISRRRKRRLKMMQDLINSKTNQSTAFNATDSIPGPDIPSLSLAVTQNFVSPKKPYDDCVKYFSITSIRPSSPFGFYHDPVEADAAEAVC